MADYPGTLPTFAAPGANLSTAPHSSMHTDLAAELVAVATTIGTNPQGTLSTIKARLDKIAPYTGAWTSWVPTITQSGAVTKTTNYGGSQRVGRGIDANCLLSITGSGTASNIITLSLPVACAIDNMVIGHGYLADSSIPASYGFNVFSTASGVNCYFVGVHNTAAATAMTLGSGVNTFNAALASGDAISMSLNYPAAAD